MKVEVLQKKNQILLQKIITYNLKFCSQKITNMFPPEKNEKSSLANMEDKSMYKTEKMVIMNRHRAY